MDDEADCGVANSPPETIGVMTLVSFGVAALDVGVLKLLVVSIVVAAFVSCAAVAVVSVSSSPSCSCRFVQASCCIIARLVRLLMRTMRPSR